MKTTAFSNCRRLLAGALCSLSIQGAWADDPADDLTEKSLNWLMNVSITTPSKVPESLFSASAAVSVLTGDDIRHSGATSIPEALRLVPGLDVARVDAHTWAISSRGFNDVFANKLLVMMDGRSVYTPLFSGVFWDVQDTLLEDIDRIEVVRGPGATLWGANAVNGVIDIISKSARDTQGLLFSGGAGSEERGFASVRYGFQASENAYLRIYGKYFNRDDSVAPSGASGGDAWELGHGGFRFDWLPAENNLTVQGDLYTGRFGQTYSVPTFAPPFAASLQDRYNAGGGNILARFTHHFAETNSILTLQAYYDRTTRNTPIFSEDRDTIDVDAQHQLMIGERQQIIWGGGFRRTSDMVGNTLSVALNPAGRSDDLYSAFVQDEITLVENQLRLTLGSKFEHNDYTGFEFQPSARLVWNPAHAQTVWGSVSRAVRTPSRAETDVAINPAGAPPGFVTVNGSGAFTSEELTAYEIGYRWQPVASLWLDLTGFYNNYDNLRTIEPTSPAPVGPTVAANNLSGETYGGEAGVTWEPVEHCILRGGYSYLETQLHLRNGSRDKASEAGEGASPRHQFFLRSTVGLGRDVDWDTVLRYVDSLPTPGVPAYITLDVRLAWRPSPKWELAVVGQNLLDDRHPEFYPTTIGTQRTEVERSVYGKVTLRF